MESPFFIGRRVASGAFSGSMRLFLESMFARALGYRNFVEFMFFILFLKLPNHSICFYCAHIHTNSTVFALGDNNKVDSCPGFYFYVNLFYKSNIYSAFGA